MKLLVLTIIIMNMFLIMTNQINTYFIYFPITHPIVKFKIGITLCTWLLLKLFPKPAVAPKLNPLLYVF
jgi:hypothetical protein